MKKLVSDWMLFSKVVAMVNGEVGLVAGRITVSRLSSLKQACLGELFSMVASVIILLFSLLINLS